MKIKSVGFSSLVLSLIILNLAVLLCGCPQQTEDKSSLNPLEEKAREHYLAGRRLFLSNNPTNYPLAMTEFQQALDAQPDYAEALAAYAETISMARGFHLSDEDFALAYTYAQRAIRLDPQLAIGYRAMADLFRHKNENDQAMLHIDRAIALDPSSAENYYVKGSILLATDRNAAKQQFEKALVLNPDLAKTYFNMAVTYQMDGDLETAEKWILKYQQAVPQDIGGYCSLGIIYRQAGKTDQAIEQLEQVIVKDVKKDSAGASLQIHWIYMAYQVLGEIYLNDIKDTQKAVAYLDKALDIFPNSLETLKAQIKAQESLGNQEKLEKYKADLKVVEAEIKQYKDKKESIIKKGLPEEVVNTLEKQDGSSVDSKLGE